ncbi:MAG: helix-turn-helix domain-containing protein [Propionibacterium sp.]|nr:helix-turn-helix domain-containing protein [Propionibacterium sp.]
MSEMVSTGMQAAASNGPSPHPALGRFLLRADAEPRLLIIRAPEGVGRRWFARSWCARDGAADEGHIVEWSPDEDAETIIRTLTRVLAEAPTSRVTLIAHASAPIARIAAAFACRVAGPADLMLREDEIAADDPAGIHDLTGGWLVAVDDLLHPSGTPESARRALLPPLARWLAARDPDDAVPEVAFLPHFTADVLLAFESPDGKLPPTQRDLLDDGLLHPRPDGEVFMPDLVRYALQDLVREQDPALVPRLVEASSSAIADTGDMETAIDTAVGQRAWPALQNLLLERWADLFTTDARKLRTAAKAFPRFLLDRTGELNTVLRVLSAAGPDRMLLPLPTLPPDLTRDRTAARLQQRALKLAERPDARAVSYGLLEISHLRLAGHFVEAAHAATRLRPVLAEATASRPVPGALGALAEIHAGMSFHLADRLPEARLAYEAGLHRARADNHHFLEADALSKLALLTLQGGHTDEARRLVEDLSEPLDKVGWGKSMVGRAGTLAKVWIALHALDLDGADDALRSLPEKPDTDEFWVVHAVLQALAGTLRGDGEHAAATLTARRDERPYSAAAPMSERMITEGLRWIEQITGTASAVPGWQRNPELANLESLRRLRTGPFDAVLHSLDTPERTNPRQRLTARSLRVRAFHNPDVDDGTLREFCRQWEESGELSDLLPLHLLGRTPELRASGILSEEQACRLEALPSPTPAGEAAPELTPREEALLTLLRQGRTRREMAQLTIRSENTIKSQLRSLYAKLDASSATEALEKSRHFNL